MQKRLRPPELEDLIGRQMIHRFEEVTLFARRLVQRDEHAPPAALLGPGPAALLRQKILQIGQQERPELSFLMSELLKVIPGQQAREKLLRQVLRLRRVASITPNVSVERRPIRVAQLLQRSGCLR